MIDNLSQDSTNGIIATIENKDNPSQVVAIKYLPDEKAFVTSGIQTHFREKEILIPAHLVVIDFQLIGAIVSGILEEISQAQEVESTFEYAPGFEVLDQKYSMTEYGEYMRLFEDEEE
ncbi:MAG: hypothetical protein JRJ15_07945 [Deltaproteobacteria bacterium]|nr:hypothetical protein [Deltaproteobacteria bacterium]